ncbi:MAG: Flp family type IVb pilin [Microbacterium sp.]
MLKAFTKAQAHLNSLVPVEEEEGATAVEYALIIGLVSIVIVLALVALVEPIRTFINDEIIARLTGGA